MEYEPVDEFIDYLQRLQRDKNARILDVLSHPDDYTPDQVEMAKAYAQQAKEDALLLGNHSIYKGAELDWGGSYSRGVEGFSK